MAADRIVGVRRATTIAAAAAALTILTSSTCVALAFAVPRGPIGGGRPKMEPLSATTDNDDASNGDKAVVAADGPRKKKVVVVGGGWAGFTAASTLASSSEGGEGGGVDVTLLDASPRGRGGLAGGWRTPGGRPVEAGIHGFWREYRNTFAVMESIEGLELDEVLAPYTPSVLVSAKGRVALAPVLGDDDEEDGGGSKKGEFKPPTSLSPEAVLGAIAPLLPPPLDVALLSKFSPASPLSVADRLSAVGLLGAWADFNQEDSDSWDRYDSITAEDLFKKYAGVTDGLYDELVSPLLHVLPMCPGYDCSAAAALSCFHVFALQSRGAFDVRWCRGGIAEKIFDPWATQLLEGGNVEIRGGARVTSIDRLESDAAATSDSSNGADAFPIEVELNGGEDTLRCDAVVLAVGGTAASNIASSSPALRSLPATQNFDKLRGVTCVAVRLFLKPSQVVTSDLEGGEHDSTQLPPDLAEAMRDSPVFVCGPRVGGMPELEETGFCVYDLQRLHDEFAVDGDGAGTPEDGSEEGDEATAVLEVDFFRADDIANISDDKDVARLALKAVAEATGTKVIPNSELVDVAVVRARNAVSHFAPSSASYSPTNGGKIGDNIYMCGDWIDRTGHASWSTEKAVVTGKQAAAAVARELGLVCRPEDMKVIPAAEDTDQLKALRTAARFVRSVAPPPDRIPPSPWKFAEGLIGGRLQR